MAVSNSKKRKRRKLRRSTLWRLLRRYLFGGKETSLKKAKSVALASFMAFTPLYGIQTYIGLLLAYLLKLNKIRVAILINIVTPYPIVPFIIYFSFKIGGVFLETPIIVGKDVEFTWQLLFDNLLQYLTGGFILATVMGILLGFLSYPLFIYLDKRKQLQKVSV